MKTVGVLALQGDFEAHRKAVDRAGGHAVEVRTAAELDACDALIIPGGESSTMLKLLDIENLTPAIHDFAARKPVLGTCAGAILMAREVTRPQQASLNLMDITVERNGYGRQIDSRIAKLDTEGGAMEAVFIRAPVIRRAGPEARILATYEGNPVWVEQGIHTAATFHPELTTDARLHRRFLAKVTGKPAGSE